MILRIPLELFLGGLALCLELVEVVADGVFGELLVDSEVSIHAPRVRGDVLLESEVR